MATILSILGELTSSVSWLGILGIAGAATLLIVSGVLEPIALRLEELSESARRR